MASAPVIETNKRLDEPPATAWATFDRIYCINLATRPDRRQKAEREFARVGLAGLVHFVTVDAHPTDSEQGIFESHISCLRAGLAYGAQRIVVFEDDILFHRFSPKVLNRSIEFMRSNADWHIFFFGCFARSSKRTPFPSILRIRYRCTAHAYVVNRPFAEKLVEMPWSGVPYDVLLSSFKDEQFYVCYPAMAYQSGSATNNDKLRNLDRMRRLIGGLRRLQRWDEFSNHRLIELIVVHSIILILCIFLALRYKGLL